MYVFLPITPLNDNITGIMESLLKILNYKILDNETLNLSVKELLIVIAILFLVSLILNLVRRFFTKGFDKDDHPRLISVFEYLKYFIYLIVILVSLNSMGVSVTGIIAGAAALLLGVGLALQTFFQDIISGIFILIDKSLQVNDIIEIDGKVGRVTKINLRTTKALTIENKVLIIPNHKYLTNTLYNWTQNGRVTRESVVVGVAYGSDVKLVKELLIKAVDSVDTVLDVPKPIVIFDDFGDSALTFKLVVSLDDSFNTITTKSDLRFEIDRLFRENQISIPFPQRDIHIISK